MKGGAKSMEQMKVSSVVKLYPNKFVIAMAMKRNESRKVELCAVLGVCDTKEEAIVQQTLFQMTGTRTFLIPTFETDEALQITIADGEYDSKPLLTPADNAKIFRDYYNL